jgi:hypothetical protein
VSYPHDETHPYPEPHSRQTLVEAGDRSEAISLFSSAGFLHTEDTSRPSERTCAEYQPSITPTNLDKTNFQLCAQRSAMWNPFWLQKSWLVAYASVFGALLTAVVALHLTSLHKNGLVSTGGTTVMIYVWRFLPTAGMFQPLSVIPNLTYVICSPCCTSIVVESCGLLYAIAAAVEQSLQGTDICIKEPARGLCIGVAASHSCSSPKKCRVACRVSHGSYSSPNRNRKWSMQKSSAFMR